MTPSAHRQQPQSAYSIRGTQLGPGYTWMSNNHPGTPFRQPLGGIGQNAYAGGGYSMSGIKTGRQPGGYMSRSGMNSGRPMGGMSFR